jgi:hypothetical protein
MLNRVRVMAFNATFNNISVGSRRKYLPTRTITGIEQHYENPE